MKVSLDGRFEAAYAPGVYEEHQRFFGARAGWQSFLDRYPTDAVLAPRSAPVVAAMGESSRFRDSWERVYDDGFYTIHLRRSAGRTCAPPAEGAAGSPP